MSLLRKFTDYLRNLANIALNSRLFLVTAGFTAGVLFDPIAMIGGISRIGWFFAGFLTILLSYIFYAYYKINQDSFDEF